MAYGLSSSLVGGVELLLRMYRISTSASTFAMTNFAAQIPRATASATVIIGSPRLPPTRQQRYCRWEGFRLGTLCRLITCLHCVANLVVIY